MIILHNRIAIAPEELVKHYYMGGGGALQPYISVPEFGLLAAVLFTSFSSNVPEYTSIALMEVWHKHKLTFYSGRGVGN